MKFFKLFFILLVAHCANATAQSGINYIQPLHGDGFRVDSILSMKGNTIVYLRAGTEFDIEKNHVEYVDHSQLGRLDINSGNASSKSVKGAADIQSSEITLEEPKGDILDRQVHKPVLLIGLGSHFYTSGRYTISENYFCPQEEIGVRYNFTKCFSIREVIAFYKGKVAITSWHESTYINNWEDRPIYNSSIYNTEGWRQKVTFYGIEDHFDAMYNPFGHIPLRHFSLFVYGGIGDYFTWHSSARDGSNFGWSARCGLNLVVQFGRVGIYLDSSYDFSEDKRLGYLQNNYINKINSSLGICIIL